MLNHLPVKVKVLESGQIFKSMTEAAKSLASHTTIYPKGYDKESLATIYILKF